jgi:hypothetical protein
MTHDDLIPVTAFITESERNLEIATVIFERYEEARGEIIKGFLDRLTADLKSKLSGWSFRYEPLFFEERYGAFNMFKKQWKGRYRIRMEALEWGERMGYGVWRDADFLKSIPLSPELLTEVK